MAKQDRLDGTLSYGEAIHAGFCHLLSKHREVFVIGQGLWAPWYVGNSMRALEKKFGTDRVIDSPVSEGACTGAAIGASLFGYKAVVVHPRMDFLILAIDQIVNQAAKWSHMFGGQAIPAVTFRGIVNRGGEQGAQHSQALHAWFAHVPGLRVVMPATPQDARDLLIASVLHEGPVLYIDDRWLYDDRARLGAIRRLSLAEEGPRVIRRGADITLVGASYSTSLCLRAAKELEREGVSAEVVDLRVINPLDARIIVESVRRTGRLCVVDGGWRTCGLAGEVIAAVVEGLPPGLLLASPVRLTLPDAPAPTSKVLEAIYYTGTGDIVRTVKTLVVKEVERIGRRVSADAS